MIFFFIQKRKIKHSIVTVSFYFEEEREKELFIALNTIHKRYLELYPAIRFNLFQ
jgi:hypothetical protein